MLDTICLFLKILLGICLFIPCLIIGSILLLAALSLLCKVFGLFGFAVFLALIFTVYYKMQENLFR